MMAQLHSVTIDDRTFVVSEREVGEIRDEILTAARDGAGFVSFEAGSRRTEVLITRTHRVRIDHYPEDDDSALGWAGVEHVPIDWGL